METEELKTIIAATVPETVFDETGEWLTASIPSTAWKKLATQLRFAGNCHFDYLFCVTCVDWKTHLSMVYHLTSTVHRFPLVIKMLLDRENPEVETVSDVWRTAELHEREQYELFGVKFLNHPDLRRLILTDDFVGWPLRKDFEDPVNMIKL
jgi:NADH-quinone oxidoreductase subunit C